LHDGCLNTYSFTKDGKKSPFLATHKKLHKSPDQLNLFLTFSEPQLKALPHKFKAFTNSEPTPPQKTFKPKTKSIGSLTYFNQMNTIKI